MAEVYPTAFPQYTGETILSKIRMYKCLQLTLRRDLFDNIRFQNLTAYNIYFTFSRFLSFRTRFSAHLKKPKA